jgi:hypothetical protein
MLTALRYQTSSRFLALTIIPWARNAWLFYRLSCLTKRKYRPGKGIAEKFVDGFDGAALLELPDETFCNGKSRINFFENCKFQFGRNLVANSARMQSSM